MKPAYVGLVTIPAPLSADAGRVERSWQRCRSAGLWPGAVPSVDHLPPGAEAPPLAVLAQPVVEALVAQAGATPAVIALAGADGRILLCHGDEPYRALLRDIGLAVGSDWSEAGRGTNAIGTCLLEGQAVAVGGAEHYLEALRNLAAVAAPVFAAESGAMAGALALFCPPDVPRAQAQALVELHAGFIEDRLFDTCLADGVELRLHPVAELLASPLAGRVLLSPVGRLRAHNARAVSLLPAAFVVGETFAAGFATPWREIADYAAGPPSSPMSLEASDGRRLFASIQRNRHGEERPASGVPEALAELGCDDPRIAEAVRRTSRIVECDIPLLIQGETGSGKEWFAQAFHRSGSRRDGPFVAVNCAAIPATLIEAELFGYAEGAFTGARRQGARGKIREADGGTLFLDEIGDMPLTLQAVLLRVLETRAVAPLGGYCEEAVNIRLVCASHQSLRDLVARGGFRADLFFRLSGMTIALPPLRERADFAAIVRRILAEERQGRSIRVAPEAFELLRRYGWPGNLRQLRNVLRLSVALLGEDGLLQPVHLPAEVRAEEEAAAGSIGLRAVQARLARETVDRHGGNISAAARELGITRTTLYRLLGLPARRPAAEAGPG